MTASSGQDVCRDLLEEHERAHQSGQIAGRIRNVPPQRAFLEVNSRRPGGAQQSKSGGHKPLEGVSVRQQEKLLT